MDSGEKAERRPGAQPGNINRLKHGFYSRRFRQLEQADLESIPARGLQDEIALMRVTIRRVFEFAVEEAADLKTWAQALAVLGAASSRLANLLRTEKLLDDGSSEVASALSQALDQMLKDLGQE
jgi:hypothetical protein